MRKKRNKNPLIKRILRELSGDWKKYLVVALFLILTIGFVSGMYVANGSMLKAAEDGKTKYKLEDGHAEALEFYIKEDSAVTNVPLNRLHIRKNILVCSIVRGGQAIIPGGQDELHVGDYVVVVLTHARLNDIKDIIEG